VFTTALFIFAWPALNGFSAWWVSEWLAKPRSNSASIYFTGIYIGIGLLQGFVALTRNLLFVWQSLSSSQKIHKSLLSKMLTFPSSFFDTELTVSE
jgi:hypothetical protein